MIIMNQRLLHLTVFLSAAPCFLLGQDTPPSDHEDSPPSYSQHLETINPFNYFPPDRPQGALRTIPYQNTPKHFDSKLEHEYNPSNNQLSGHDFIKQIHAQIKEDLTLVKKCDCAGRTPLHIALNHSFLALPTQAATCTSSTYATQPTRASIDCPDWSQEQFQGQSLMQDKESLELVSTLLNNRADTNACDIWNNTPLHLAAFRAPCDIASMLIKYDGLCNTPNACGFTPLAWAIISGRNDLVRILLFARAECDGTIKMNRSSKEYGLLTLACAAKNWAAAQSLVEHNAPLTAIIRDAAQPHFFSIKYKKTLPLTDIFGRYPIEHAAHNDQETLVKTMIAKGALREFINRCSSYEKCNELFTKELIINNLNEPDSDGNTILHHAAAYNKKDIVLLLIHNKAKIDYLNHEGKTPSQIATEKGHNKLAEFIAEHQSHEFTE